MSYIGNQPKAKLWGYTPQSAAPANPREGDVYNDDGTVQAIAGLYLYQGSTWKLLRMVGTVDTADLVDGAVTADKIDDGAVTPAKLSTGHPEWDSSSNFKMNSGYGSNAIAYGCRAWVQFNGTGTVAINASGNVSSITDNSAGNYTINFTTSMPDAKYAIAGTCKYAGGGVSLTVGIDNIATPLTASAAQIYLVSDYSVSVGDSGIVTLVVFR